MAKKTEENPRRRTAQPTEAKTETPEVTKTPGVEDLGDAPESDETDKGNNEETVQVENKGAKESTEKSKAKVEENWEEANTAKADKAPVVEVSPLQAKVEVTQKEPKLVKVKFIENHTFNKGIEKINAKVGQTLNVETHLANKFVSRKIAYIVG